MYIGIDLGGTNIAVGLVDEDGKILYKSSCETKCERGTEFVIKDIIKLIEEVIKKSKHNEKDIKSIGIGIPGISNEEGVVIRCINLKWRRVSLRKPLEERFRVPIFIENDARVAGLAEYAIGALKGYENSLLLTLGTGIGSGIIINGKMYGGAQGIGSEIGHMVVGENFYTCNCGANGCLETFASSTALIKYVQRCLDDGVDSKYLNEFKNNLNAEVILGGINKNDEVCIRAYERFIKYLVIGIRNIINILNPEVIAFGGGISNMGEKLLEDIERGIEKNYNKDLPMPKLILAKMKNDAGIVGAALMGRF
ncbi:ROK family protein [Hathewaya histolytica]|uniref:Glucokinase n=1 Tax=Hathewaya histolytica TaxID=1498 RepID=A0A4U9R0P4_HATHI|nr:ROK family protein [Hathewaya histolytica]VTQ83463.1 glucokinase [Hathewaya histolytica]